MREKYACIPKLASKVLYGFSDGEDCWDWIPGEHGIIINFEDPRNPKRTYQATYLPEVPVGSRN